jgi:hypothetical protein
VSCFGLLVGSGIDVNMNGWCSGDRGVYMCNESRSTFYAGGDV